jgi:glycosyltransferase involved in cell wall biosynthesis
VAESRRGLSVRPLVVDLGRDFRGGQDQALLLLRGLLKRGHAPQLITLGDSLLARRAREAGVTVHEVPPRGRRLATYLMIRRLLRTRHVDVVHANEPHALTSAWLARAHRFVPLVVSRRVELPLSSDKFSMARYRAASRVVAVSDFVEKSMRGSGLSADRIEIIFVGVEIPAAVSSADRELARKRFAIPQDSVCLGNVAAFVPEKGHVLLLHAFAELRAQFPQCVLLLAGEGREKASLHALVRQLRLEEIVKFPGFVSDVESVYAATDLFVFPSHQEPLACAMLSAMAHGLPVVAFDRGGNPEAIEDGKNGLLVKDLDATALAVAMAHLVAHPHEASRLGRTARETVQSRFSADRMAEETLRLYERLVAAGNSLNSRS